MTGKQKKINITRNKQKHSFKFSSQIEMDLWSQEEEENKVDHSLKDVFFFSSIIGNLDDGWHVELKISALLWRIILECDTMIMTKFHKIILWFWIFQNKREFNSYLTFLPFTTIFIHYKNENEDWKLYPDVRKSIIPCVTGLMFACQEWELFSF